MLLKIIYGYQVDPSGLDPLVRINERMVEIFASVTVPGAWLVDIVPWLRCLPDRMPGTEFKKVARNAQRVVTAAADVPFQFAKQTTLGNIQGRSQAGPFLVEEVLGLKEKDKSISDDDILWTANTLYGAGVDTTSSALRAFFLAMSVYPDVQKRAQKEIDRIGGISRLPRLEDRANLPYINAVIKECLRWLPSVPLIIPHAAQKDDELDGFRIPKGAILIPSIWWFSRDPAIYHDPERFMPERYPAPFEEPDPAGFVFGLGRRICPGRRLADSTLFLAVAKVLATFDVSKARDAEGREIEPETGIGTGAVVGPIPFSVAVTPRNEAVAQLIRAMDEEHPAEGDAKYLDQEIWNIIT